MDVRNLALHAGRVLRKVMGIAMAQLQTGDGWLKLSCTEAAAPPSVHSDDSS